MALLLQCCEKSQDPGPGLRSSCGLPGQERLEREECPSLAPATLSHG